MARGTTAAHLMGKAATITAFAELGIRQGIADHPARQPAIDAAAKAYQTAADAGRPQPERNQAALDAALAVVQAGGAVQA